MQLDELIEAATKVAGSQAALARKLGLKSQGNVTDWKAGRHCPDWAILSMARIAGLPPLETALEVYKERLGKLAKTLALGVAAISLVLGAFAGARPAVAGEPMRDDV